MAPRATPDPPPGTPNAPLGTPNAPQMLLRALPMRLDASGTTNGPPATQNDAARAPPEHL